MCFFFFFSCVLGTHAFFKLMCLLAVLRFSWPNYRIFLCVSECNAKVIYLYKKKPGRIEFTHSLMWFQTCGGKRERERALSASRHVVITEFENFSRCYIHSVYDSVVCSFFFTSLARPATILAARLSLLHFILYTYIYIIFFVLFFDSCTLLRLTLHANTE